MSELALSIEMLPTGSLPSLLKFPLYFHVCFVSNEKVSLTPRKSNDTLPPFSDQITIVITWLLERKQLRETVPITPTGSMNKKRAGYGNNNRISIRKTMVKP